GRRRGSVSGVLASGGRVRGVLEPHGRYRDGGIRPVPELAVVAPCREAARRPTSHSPPSQGDRRARTRKDPRVDGNRGIRSLEIRGSPPTVRRDYLRGHLRRVSHLAGVRTHRLRVAVAESTSPAPAAQGRSSLEG